MGLEAADRISSAADRFGFTVRRTRMLIPGQVRAGTW